jgi:hypothetical protein
MGLTLRSFLAGILFFILAGLTAGQHVALAAAAATTTALAATPAPAVTGQTVQLKATVDCGTTAPTGTATFFHGTTVLGQSPVGAGGVATLNHAFNAGQHSLTATCGGDSNCAASTGGPITENVITAGTTTMHTSAPNPSSAGQPVTLTATVTVKSPGSGTPTGTVSFFDQRNSGQNLGTATLGANGNPANQASVQVSTLSVGQHDINAQYNGDSNRSIRARRTRCRRSSRSRSAATPTTRRSWTASTRTCRRC